MLCNRVFLIRRVPSLQRWSTKRYRIIMGKRNYNQSRSEKKLKGEKFQSLGSDDEVLCKDVNSLLEPFQRASLSPGREDAAKPLRESMPDRFSEIEVSIEELSSNGSGIGFGDSKDHVFVVPFTVPGDRVIAKVVTHFPKARYMVCDLIRITKKGPSRQDELAKCQYFAKCAGCQLQMLSYEEQLQHKKQIIAKAYRNFSGLIAEMMPSINDTIGSPMQYGYRTKLTPHFDGPPGSLSRRARHDPSFRIRLKEVPAIGFQAKGFGRTLDIEDCPIGTDAVRAGMKRERQRIAETFSNYTKGATILLRENTKRETKSGSERSPSPSKSPGPGNTLPQNIEEKSLANGKALPPYVDTKTCITDQKAIAVEYIDDFVFHNPAGSFFQNNNSILPAFTAYIRDHILPPSASTFVETAQAADSSSTPPIKYLIDAYCGSGLFTVTLSSLFESSLGIDIAGPSIKSAWENAAANNIKNATFLAADAPELFREVTFPSEQTAVVIDPPRRGCDEAFLRQLLDYGPQRIVYVSCNVHTQARDVGVLVVGNGKSRYDLESLQGFDFFPQTGHVEGVAVLSKSDESKVPKPQPAPSQFSALDTLGKE